MNKERMAMCDVSIDHPFPHQGVITAVRPLQLEVRLANKWRGRVHITEALITGKATLAGTFKVDQEIEAEVLGTAKALDSSDTGRAQRRGP